MDILLFVMINWFVVVIFFCCLILNYLNNKKNIGFVMYNISDDDVFILFIN